ncbi:hypothetical protein KHQ81_15540 (plasmid) [Mycoplasmatota bacterium]|nr:hypothetical protein KHQ81_15540 [Mycoplasmatota bacterium]
MKQYIKNCTGSLSLEFMVILPIIMVLIMLALNSVKYNMNASAIIKDTYQAGRFSTIYESCELAKDNLVTKFPNYNIYYKYINYGNNNMAQTHNSSTQTQINTDIKNGHPIMILECNLIWDREEELTITASKRNYTVGMDLIIPQDTAERITLYIEYEHPIHKQCEKYETEAKTISDILNTTDPISAYYQLLQNAKSDIEDNTFEPATYCK